MRINGSPSHSYPVKRKPRKDSARIDEHVEEGEFDVAAHVQAAQQRARSAEGGVSNVPARQQDMIFPRSMSRRAAEALGLYLTTATFVDWDMEVLGLDLHI